MHHLRTVAAHTRDLVASPEKVNGNETILAGDFKTLYGEAKERTEEMILDFCTENNLFMVNNEESPPDIQMHS